MMDPRGGHPGMRGGMIGGDPRDRRMPGPPPHMGGPPNMGGGGGGRPGDRAFDDRMSGRPPVSQGGRPVSGGMGPGDYRGIAPPSGLGGGLGGSTGREGQQVAQAPAQKTEQPAKPKLTVDQMEKRIASTLEEYVEIQEFSEVEETLKEMPSKECHPFVIYKAVDVCCNVPKHKPCLVCIHSIPFPLCLKLDMQLCHVCCFCLLLFSVHDLRQMLTDMFNAGLAVEVDGRII